MSMKRGVSRRWLLAGAILLSAAAPAQKATSSLTADDLDPHLVLPPPPATGSAQARAELAELHAMQSARTEAETRAASADGTIKDATIFAEVLGPSFDLKRLPATAHLFDLVRAAEKNTVDRGKDSFKRPRPWIVDPSIVSCTRGDDPLSSYPSGHTTMAFSMAAVLARLVPARASAIMARAARYGETRIICEQHFRSDVTAGETLGLLVAERLMTKPDFRQAFDAARRELEVARVPG